MLVIGGQGSSLTSSALESSKSHHPTVRKLQSSITVKVIFNRDSLDVEGLLSSGLIKYLGLLPLDGVMFLPCMADIYG